MQKSGTAAKDDSEERLNFDRNSPQANLGAAEQAIAPAAEGVAATVTALKEGVSQISSKTQAKVAEVVKSAQKYGGEAIEETRSFVRRNPGQALLIGFGTGLLIGYSLTRK